MPTYIGLIDYTQQGIENIKDGPERLAEAKSLAESMGGKFDFYMTFGEYDAVTIGEFPDDETYAQLVLAITSGGAVRTTSLKAFNEEEFLDVIAGIPG